MTRHSRRLSTVVATAALIFLAGCAASGPSNVPSPTVAPVATALPTAAATVVASSPSLPQLHRRRQTWAGA